MAGLAAGSTWSRMTNCDIGLTALSYLKAHWRDLALVP
jgi:hypothetical protein